MKGNSAINFKTFFPYQVILKIHTDVLCFYKSIFLRINQFLISPINTAVCTMLAHNKFVKGNSTELRSPITLQSYITQNKLNRTLLSEVCIQQHNSQCSWGSSYIIICDLFVNNRIHSTIGGWLCYFFSQKKPLKLPKHLMHLIEATEILWGSCEHFFAVTE